MKKQPQITEQTKANLRTAFWKLYTEKPLDKISVKEITDLAGYNRGTFYLYYKDVYDILSQMEEDLLGRVQSVLTQAMQQNDTFDLSTHMGVLLELMQTHSQYATVLLSDHGDPRFTRRLKEILQPFLDRCFLSTDTLNPYEQSLLSEFYLAGLLSVIIHWNANPQMRLDAFIDFIIKNILSGSYLRSADVTNAPNQRTPQTAGFKPDSPQSCNNCGKSTKIPADK